MTNLINKQQEKEGRLFKLRGSYQPSVMCRPFLEADLNNSMIKRTLIRQLGSCDY